MAITKILKISNLNRLSNSLNYITSPLKTDNDTLVNSYNCCSETAGFEFGITQLNAKKNNGDYTNTGGNNIYGYHLIQSFDINDNVTPEQANKIGQALADEFLEGKFEYVIATHVDKSHIHNHIIINSTSFLDNKKLRTQPYITAAKLRGISDALCEENKLNVIENPYLKKRNGYLEWVSKKNNIHWKEELTLKLEFCLNTSNNLEDFKQNLKRLDVDVSFFNENNNLRKHPLFKYKNFKPVRGRSLIDDLDIDKIKKILSTNIQKNEKNKNEDMVDSFNKFVYNKSQVQIQLKGSEIKSISPKGILIEIEKGKNIFIDNKDVIINNSKITISINKYLRYSIKSQSGNKNNYKRVKGSELIDYYNKNKNSYQEMSLTNQIKFAQKKQLVADTKDTANLLYFASKHNISITEVSNVLTDELDDLKKGINNLTKDINTYIKIRNTLQTVKSNQKIYDNYFDKDGMKKQLFYRKNHKDIDEYLFAVSELEKNKIDINMDIDKLDILIEKKKQQLLEQKKIFENKESDLQKYKKVIDEMEL